MTNLTTADQNRLLLDLARRERHLAVELVVELASFAKRERHRELGYGSLFYYCLRQLGLSKSTSFRRSEAALLIARFPAIAGQLVEGKLSIRALVELREVLTAENHAAVLARAAGMTQEQAQLLAVEIKPRPIPRDLVRAVPVASVPVPFVPVPAASEAFVPLPAPLARSTSAASFTEASRPPVPAETSAAKETVTLLTRDLRRLNVTVSAAFMDRLELVREALSHEIPDGAFEKVVDEAFKLVLERDRKRKALTERPRARVDAAPAARPEANPRYVPAAVKRAVWKRDGGKCTWPMGDGHVCGSRKQLQFDHHLEVALGGLPTFENVRLLCRMHNVMKAELHLGREFMARFRKRQAPTRGADLQIPVATADQTREDQRAYPASSLRSTLFEKRWV